MLHDEVSQSPVRSVGITLSGHPRKARLSIKIVRFLELRELCGFGHGPDRYSKVFPLHHYSPCNAGGLVGHRHRNQPRGAPLEKAIHPIGSSRCLRARIAQHRCGAGDEKPSNIGVSLFRYPAKPIFAAAGILPWSQAKPGCKFTTGFKKRRVRNHSGDCRCGEDADARNCRKPTTCLIRLVPSLDRMPPTKTAF